jgi:hypothetical protein
VDKSSSKAVLFSHENHGLELGCNRHFVGRIPKDLRKKTAPATFPSIPKCSESEASAAKILGISMEDPQ